MLRESRKTYPWKKYDRLILAAASVIGWFPISWIIYLAGYFLWIILLPSTAFLAPEIKFGSYVIICIAIQYMVFGVFAFRYPEIYILPTWLVCLAGFVLSMRRIGASIIKPNDLNILDHSSSLADYYSFSWLNILLAFFMLCFLIILLRPALFYVKTLWRKGF